MTPRPRLSVVVASSNARTTIVESLATTLEQCGRDNAEVIVVDNSTDGTAAAIRRTFPDLSIVPAPPSALIPELWAHGILASRGDIVAITTAHCVPAANWVHEILRAHAEDEAAIGGAIENDEAAGVIDWAIYFCRYSAYMLPLVRAESDDLAGDNASYRRAHLDSCSDAWTEGFWEPGVHARLRSKGVRLRLEPEIVIRHKRSFGPVRFMVQRLRHGNAFAAERAGRLSTPDRIVRIALAPALPAVLLVRIARRVFAKRRCRLRLIASLPFVLLFLLAWSAGELFGYIRGPSR